MWDQMRPNGVTRMQRKWNADIPADRIITYVNPVCVEKTHDDGTINFRMRLTIGGDRIQYPYSTTAVTAKMKALKLLLN
jgi:hypothetical protein